MSGVSEKARFYLERAVPQLREFEAKNIFSADEIRSLVRKRTEFEHRVLSPGCKPQDWLAYVAWEKSLEALRSKRCRRLQIRTSSTHAGQGRVFSILERAVNKHPGSLELWNEYLAFAQDVRATKRYRKIMTRALRMHPSNPDFWVTAARRSAANGDMQAARGFFMRAARFCTRDPIILLEYARCEMEWLARMDAKRAAAGKKGRTATDAAQKAIEGQAERDDDEIKLHDGDSDEEDDEDADEDGNLILPDPDATTSSKSKVIDEDAAAKLTTKNPALDGAIPLAIFGIAQKQTFFKPVTAERFFDLFATFSNVQSQTSIIQHVVETMTEQYPNDPSSLYCYIRQPLVGHATSNPTYPKALREALARIKTSLASAEDNKVLGEKLSAWIDSILSSPDLDVGLRTVLEHTQKTLPRS